MRATGLPSPVARRGCGVLPVTGDSSDARGVNAFGTRNTLSSMHTAALRLEIRIPDARSLKAKRSVLRPVLKRLRDRELSVAEVDHQDDWQRATIGVAVVAPQRARLDELVDGLQRLVLNDPTVELIEMGVSYLEEP